MRVGKIDDLEDLGTSEPAELRCFHDVPHFRRELCATDFGFRFRYV
jgi:hypothetical protein